MDAMSEMLTRLPLNLDRVTKEYATQSCRQQQTTTDRAPRHVSAKDHARLAEMCLRCTAVVFDCLVYHFKALRGFENFQTLWLKYITTLAQNAHLGTAGSDMKGESVDMIGSLLRLLHRPPMSDSAASNKDKDKDKSTDMETDMLLSADKKPRSGSGSGSVGDGDHKVLSDDTLMLVSWRAAKAGCPSLVALLQSNHPLIVETILALENKHNSEKEGVVAGGESSAGSKSSSGGDQRSFYSRLFEFKSQIV